MNREQVVQIVNKFLVEDLEIDENLLKENASIKNDLKIDSLDFVDIAVCVEKYFGFKMKPNDMTNVKTLCEFYDYVITKL